MFSVNHILYMLLVLLFTLIFWKIVRKGIIKFENFLKFAAILALCLDPMYWIWEYNSYGFLNYKVTFPLYQCSLFWFLLPIIAFSKKRGLLFKICLSSISTIVYYGAILGLIFNNHVGKHNFSDFVVQYSLFYHSLMFLTISLIWLTGYYKVEKYDKYLAFIPLFILMIPAYIVDSFNGYDYLYFNGAKETVMASLSNLIGTPLFVLIFYGLMFIVTYLFLAIIHKNQTK